jgi:hypothetical protein
MSVNWEFKRFSEDNSIWKQICLENNYDVFWKHSGEPIWKEVWRWYTECNTLLDDDSLFKMMEQSKDKNKVFRARRVTSDGIIYKGEWRAGLKDGKGIQIWAEGDIYKGEWRSNKRSGFGIHLWPDGHYYGNSHSVTITSYIPYIASPLHHTRHTFAIPCITIASGITY